MTTPPNHNTADQSGADERAKFEAWSRSMDLILDGNYYNSYVGAHYVYSDFTTDTAFRAFRAALQSNQAPQPFPAPAVQSGELPELPHLIPTDDLGIRQAMLEYARQAIAQTAPAVAGEAIPAYTTGHCEYNKQPGGCQQHNLHCGWPKCDQKEIK